MNCPQHPTRRPLGLCTRCGKITCELCVKYVVGALFCNTCGVATVRSRVFHSTDRVKAYRPPVVTRSWRKPAAVSAIVVGGLLLYKQWPRVEPLLLRAQETGETTGRAMVRSIAKQELATLARLVVYYATANARYPEDMKSFAAQSLDLPPERTPGLDLYGNVYVLEPIDDSHFRLSSPGPDHRPKTQDDLAIEI